MKFRIGWCLLLIVQTSVVVHGTGVVRSDCVCGKSNTVNSGRIVNGRTTQKNQYPWVAAMFFGDMVICGGSVISDKNILTAAHCYFYSPYPFASRWAIGMHNQYTRDGRFYNIEHYEIHPRFNNYSVYDDYDMTIVRLQGRIKFNNAIRPVCFNYVDENYYDLMAYVAGWGRLSDYSDETPDELQETAVKVRSNEFCAQETEGTADFNTNSMICAYTRDTDSCQGDSGGPLFYESHPNRYELIGVVSFGDGCARDFPGVYAKTANADTQRWIKNYIIRSGGDVCSDPAGKMPSNWFDF